MESLYKRARWAADVILPAATFVTMALAVFMVFVYAPRDSYQGDVQRIFYFHVPSAMVTFVAVGVVAFASAMFLWRGTAVWDRLAHSSAEIGLLLCTMVLTVGPIWAKPIWGTWWTWDARLTSTLVLWLIYAAYLMLRSFTTSSDQAARYAAVLGIVGAVDVPIINKSVYWWRTIHPAVIVNRGGGTGLSDPRMQLTLLVCIAAFFLLYLLLLWVRFETGRLRSSVDAIRERAMEA